MIEKTFEKTNRKTADIFIRFPFCAHRHALCTELTFDAGSERIRRYMDALKREMEVTAQGEQGTWIRSVTIGGGSPVLMEERLLSSLLGEVRELFSVAPDAQMTLETEPQLLRSESMIRFQRLNINRLVIRLLTGRHSDFSRYHLPGNIGTAQTALMLPQLFSMPSYAPVILYGLPGQTADHFLVSTRFCCKFHAPEVIFERFIPVNHALFQALALPEKTLPGAEEAECLTEKARKHLIEKGYLEYRPGRFALPSFIPSMESDPGSGGDQADLLGFGVNCISRSGGITYKSTGILPRYLEHAADPDQIYHLI